MGSCGFSKCCWSQFPGAERTRRAEASCGAVRQKHGYQVVRLRTPACRGGLRRTDRQGDELGDELQTDKDGGVLLFVRETFNSKEQDGGKWHF